jgi:hypothetical protein
LGLANVSITLVIGPLSLGRTLFKVLPNLVLEHLIDESGLSLGHKDNLLNQASLDLRFNVMDSGKSMLVGGEW